MEDMDPEVPVVRKRNASPRPRRRLSRGLYILPSLFTTANMAAGYFAILQVIHGSPAEPWHFDNAAKAIGDCLRPRWSGWKHCAHDRHQQRLWPRAGLAGRCDQLWRGPGHAGLDVGFPRVIAVVAPGVVRQAGPVGRNRQLSLPDCRRQPPGPFQYQPQSGTLESRGVRGRNTLSACPFPPARA